MKDSQHSAEALLSALVARRSGDTMEAGESGERGDVGNVTKEGREASDASRSGAYDRRHDRERGLEERISEWERGFDQLASEAENLTGEDQSDLQARIDQLGRGRRKLTAEVGRLAACSEETWRAVRDRVVDSMESLEEALDDAWTGCRMA